jgi:hypothetical protein
MWSIKIRRNFLCVQDARQPIIAQKNAKLVWTVDTKKNAVLQEVLAGIESAGLKNDLDLLRKWIKHHRLFLGMAVIQGLGLSDPKNKERVLGILVVCCLFVCFPCFPSMVSFFVSFIHFRSFSLVLFPLISLVSLNSLIPHIPHISILTCKMQICA